MLLAIPIQRCYLLWGSLTVALLLSLFEQASITPSIKARFAATSAVVNAAAVVTVNAVASKMSDDHFFMMASPFRCDASLPLEGLFNHYFA